MGAVISLDTKYRPIDYNDVLGQEAAIKILRQFVATGKGRHQSYLFCGPYGSGKTTLSRILARALLCENPSERGDPCNACPSCKAILKSGSSSDFVEVDAATNSGKDEILKITESIQFDSFSGRRRIYLFDEAHQLSAQALDALLKPLEENFDNTLDKRLVCIFCTTEPEKMRDTIFSRCAPAFVIQPVTPKDIAVRLEHVCKEENIPYEKEVLLSLAEIMECHIRDALKAIEGLAMLGGVTRENVVSYLRLDLNTSYLELLELLGKDQQALLDSARKVLRQTSPTICYSKLAEIALLAYQSTLGPVTIPVYLNEDRIRKIGDKFGPRLLTIATQLASHPGRPTESMLLCDLGVLHHGGGVIIYQTTSATQAMVPPKPTTQHPMEMVGTNVGPKASGNPSTALLGAVNNSAVDERSRFSSDLEMEPLEFGKLLGRILLEERQSGWMTEMHKHG